MMPHNLSVRARYMGHQLWVITGKMTLTEIFRVQSIYAALLYNKAKPVFSSSTGTLQWRHNECDSVSNHRHIDCLLNCLFRHRKHQSSMSLAFVRGIHRWPVNSLHKGTVTQKKLPFDDIIMELYSDEASAPRMMDCPRLWFHASRAKSSEMISAAILNYVIGWITTKKLNIWYKCM